MSAAKRILVITGGHRVALDDFLGAIGVICQERGWVFAHAVQPAAQNWLSPEHAGQWDAILLHDIPGLALKRGVAPAPIPPAPGVAEDLVALLDAGQGVVVLHHAISSWPAWEGWAEAIGGRFLYAPGTLRGVDLPSSGYRVGPFTVTVTAPEHPICAGVTDFAVDDELYFAPVLNDRITPILGDITNLSPASGLLDAEFASYLSRVHPTAVICQAVLHHVVITQGTPMPFAVEALARFGAPVQIEFATEEDEKVRLLLSQIPNWSGDYSTAALLDALRARFAHVDQVGTTSPTRVVVNAWN
jgi:hypothetical protein